MTIGTNLRHLREERGLTQEQVADKMDVTFQAVSAWERDEYKPDIDKLIRLAELYDVSVSALVEEKTAKLTPKDTIYNWEHMKTYVKTTAQTRKRSDVPYIYHPLNLACHALAMNITDDSIIAACLLHDVIEDCGKTADDLPVGDEAKELVLLLTCAKTTPETRTKILNKYYKAISANPKASLIKCLDRVNNLTTMSWGLSREKIFRMINETEEYFPRLLKVIKSTPEYNDAAWLLQYQMESLLDVYKRLM